MELVNRSGSSASRMENDLSDSSPANDPRPANGSNSDPDQIRSINGLIQSEIIPRLLVVHSAGSKRSEFFEGRRAKQAEIKRFAPLALEREADDLHSEVDKLRQAGVSTESILVDVLPASARLLGKLWEEDQCDFVDVTLGLWTLRGVLRECAMTISKQFDSLDAHHSALFSPFPGERHNFGSLVVEEIFANAGWQTEVLLEPQRHELIHILTERPFDLVGLTVSCDCLTASISDLITAIRSVSKNSNVRVIIGGPLINADPSLALRAGADGTAEDARSALALAERIVAGSLPVTSPVP